jgi:hypothetical protein
LPIFRIKKFSMAEKTISPLKIVLLTSAFLVILVIALALRPLPEATTDNCLRFRDVVMAVKKGNGETDIVLKLMKDKNYYYINRGLENGLALDNLKSRLLYKDVELLVIKHWTPLDPAFHTRHIAQLAADGEVVYTEIKK